MPTQVQCVIAATPLRVCWECAVHSPGAAAQIQAPGCSLSLSRETGCTAAGPLGKWQGPCEAEFPSQAGWLGAKASPGSTAEPRRAQAAPLLKPLSRSWNSAPGGPSCPGRQCRDQTNPGLEIRSMQLPISEMGTSNSGPGQVCILRVWHTVCYQLRITE